MATKGFCRVLLIEDAVYAATKGAAWRRRKSSRPWPMSQIYALGPDLDARGMSARSGRG
jgi:sulfur relay protein TusB/DsrH